ncbi:MAG: 16S rRNA (uracil(1498)-N(3))-methyltransferase [Pseudomonadota bacterium]
MTRIYTDDETLRVGQRVVLGKAPSNHIAKVLRMRVGEAIVLFNGDNSDYVATLVETKGNVVAEIEQQNTSIAESPLHITLAQGISRSDRMDYTIQKSVELGISSIQPLITVKSNFKLDPDRVAKKLRHWRAVVISACEQCGRSVIPALAEPVQLGAWINELTTDSIAYVLDPTAAHSLSEKANNQATTIVVGPESGFSTDELNSLAEANIQRVHLGPRVLRTETAASTAITILQSKFGDLS